MVAPGVLDRIPLLLVVRQSRPSVCPSSFVVVVFCGLVAVNKSSETLSVCVQWREIELVPDLVYHGVYESILLAAQRLRHACQKIFRYVFLGFSLRFCVSFWR